MANFQTALGHVGEAQRWNQEARKRNPEGPDIWRQECYGFLNLGDALSADDCAKQFTGVHPKKLQTVNVWYALQLYRGEWDAAIATRESLLERFPGRRNSIRFLADLIARQADFKRARH